MKNALVVDDEYLIRLQVVEVLENYGFDHIYQADNGEDALNLAWEHRPLLTVMDFSMPRMNGVEAAIQMNKTPCGAIILLTGAVDDSTVTSAMDAGIHQYLMKPFNERQLGICIDMAINQFIELSSLHEEVNKLQNALDTKEIVARAKGHLIKNGLTEPQAHRRMQKLSMDQRKSLKEIAAAIIERGKL